MMIIGLVGDIPLSWVLVTLCRPQHPWWIHGTVMAVGLGAVGWAMAWRSVSRAVPHVVDERMLWLGGGVAYAGSIPRTSIRSIRTFNESRHAWAAANQTGLHDVLIVTRPDAPNVVIELEDSAVNLVQLTRNGKPVASKRWIMLYADRPGELVAAAS